MMMMNNIASSVFLTEDASFLTKSNSRLNKHMDKLNSSSYNNLNATPVPFGYTEIDYTNENRNKETGSSIDLRRIDSNRPSTKPIFISYEPNVNFQEKKFTVDLIQQLKENSLNDIWFDKDEVLIGSPSWTTTRLNAIDKSLAALLVITQNYFENQLTALESEAAYDLKCANNTYFLAVIVVNFKTNARLSNGFDTERSKKNFPLNFNLLHPLIEKSDVFINLNEKNLWDYSLSEKVNYCVGQLTKHFEKYSNNKLNKRKSSFERNEIVRYDINQSPISYRLYASSTPSHSLPTCRNCNAKRSTCNRCLKAYTNKKLVNLTCSDVQMLLEDIRIDEFYRMNFADLQVDGFMLLACTEDDFIHIFDVDNKVQRRRLKNFITDIFKEEMRGADNWHHHLRSSKTTIENSAYVIFDPTDHNSILPFLSELKANEIDVSFHNGLTSGKDVFMKEDGTKMAQCKNIIIYLTENSAYSYFVLYECVFSQLILNKTKLIVVMVKNVWKNMKASLKAMLGDQIALDFTTTSFKANVKQLSKLLKQRVNYHEPNFIMEKDGNDNQQLKSLYLLANTYNNYKIRVSISQVTDHWDTQNRLEQLLSSLETFNINCWFDLFSVDYRKKPLNQKNFVEDYKTANGTNKSPQVILCCITQKYVASEVCIKDLSLAESMSIPIIPIMLKPCSWPPEGTQYQVKRILTKLNCIDISNNTLLKRNLPKLISAIHHSVNKT